MHRIRIAYAHAPTLVNKQRPLSAVQMLRLHGSFGLHRKSVVRAHRSHRTGQLLQAETRTGPERRL